MQVLKLPRYAHSISNFLSSTGHLDIPGLLCGIFLLNSVCVAMRASGFAPDSDVARLRLAEMQSIGEEAMFAFTDSPKVHICFVAKLMLILDPSHSYDCNVCLSKVYRRKGIRVPL